MTCKCFPDLQIVWMKNDSEGIFSCFYLTLEDVQYALSLLNFS